MNFTKITTHYIDATPGLQTDIIWKFLQNGQISTLTCSSNEVNLELQVSISGESVALKTCSSAQSCSTSYTFDGTGTRTVTCYSDDKAGNSATRH